MADLHLLSPKGFKAGGVYAGIKSKKMNDVGLLVADGMATAAAVSRQTRYSRRRSRSAKSISPGASCAAWW